MNDFKAFRFDSLIEERDFCNFSQERQRLFHEISKSHKVLLYGRRNFGKTSLVRNIVAQDWMRNQQHVFFLYVDFYGVRSISGIVSRLSTAFTASYQNAFPGKTIFNKMLDLIKRLRPRVEVEPDGQMALSLGLDGPPVKSITAIFRELQAIQQHGVPVLVVFDEFQDIHFVSEAEEVIRSEMEAILADLPVVILGSKKHLLTKMFSRPNAAFYNWGSHIELQFIPYDEYTEYANERFFNRNLKIDNEQSRYLQDLMGRVPEAMNRLADSIMDFGGDKIQEITRPMIDRALSKLVQSRSGSFEEYIGHFTNAEEQLLVALAHEGGHVEQFTGKEFIAKSKLSISGIRKVVQKLEDEAVLYRESDGYYLADPLLLQHLIKYRAP